MGVSKVIKKPIDESNVLQAFAWAVQQERSPTVPITILNQIRKALEKKDQQEIVTLKQMFFAHESVTEGQKKQLEAEILYAYGSYEAAKESCVEALKLMNNSASVLNLLGRSMMKLRDFEGAMNCLENAHILSPLNIERLCNMAEINVEMGDEKSAHQTIKEAKKIDNDAEKIKETEVKIALVSYSSPTAKKMIENLLSLENIISFTNNRGVALIRKERYEEGIKFYNEALASMPDNRNDIKALVHYNLGLAYIKNDNTDLGLDALEKALKCNYRPITIKVQSLKSRIEKARKQNISFSLNIDESKPSTTDDEKDLELKMILGDLHTKNKNTTSCCSGLYFDRVPSPEIEKLLTTKLRFSVEDGLVREETLGLDKAAKAKA